MRRKRDGSQDLAEGENQNAYQVMRGGDGERMAKGLHDKTMCAEKAHLKPGITVTVTVVVDDVVITSS